MISEARAELLQEEQEVVLKGQVSQEQRLLNAIAWKPLGMLQKQSHGHGEWNPSRLG